MRELEIAFAWYTSANASVEFDLEDWHTLDDATSDEAVAYVIDELSWFGLPSIDGKTYVSDEIYVCDEYDDGDLRVRYATLTGFSAEELKKIAQGLDAQRS